jgi:hypothetical protein
MKRMEVPVAARGIRLMAVSLAPAMLSDIGFQADAKTGTGDAV